MCSARGNTALHYAALNGDIDLATAILTHSAGTLSDIHGDLVHLVNSDGETAVDIAQSAKNAALTIRLASLHDVPLQRVKAEPQHPGWYAQVPLGVRRNIFGGGVGLLWLSGEYGFMAAWAAGCAISGWLDDVSTYTGSNVPKAARIDDAWSTEMGRN